MKPDGRGGRLRPLNEPRRVVVRTEGTAGTGAGGRPREVVLPTLPRRIRAVEAIRETWRIDDEWWRVPISRLYHQVVLEGGQLVTVYRDLEGGGWYLQG